MITSERPNVSENGRYTISETCKLLGICRDSLRKYTNWKNRGGVTPEAEAA